MGVFRGQVERATAYKAACAECKAEVDLGRRTPDEVNASEGECVLCHMPCCESHGQTYDHPTCYGWAHETCHESPDYSHDGS